MSEPICYLCRKPIGDRDATIFRAGTKEMAHLPCYLSTRNAGGAQPSRGEERGASAPR